MRGNPPCLAGYERPQPVERAVNPSPATVRKELYTIVVLRATPGTGVIWGKLIFVRACEGSHSRPAMMGGIQWEVRLVRAEQFSGRLSPESLLFPTYHLRHATYPLPSTTAEGSRQKAEGGKLMLFVLTSDSRIPNPDT